MKEKFKTISYKGIDVTVSNLGKIIWNGKERKHYYNADGYSVVSLKIPNKGWRSVGVHILVATAFVENPNNFPEVNHKDYNRKNPRCDNLEWIEHGDNVRYSKCNMPDYHGENNPNFGNNTLSKKYATNPKYAKEKQSRPGISNGRATKVSLYYDDEIIGTFDYIALCCQYFIDNNLTTCTTPEGVRGQLNKCLRNNKKYKGHYSIVKG